MRISQETLQGLYPAMTEEFAGRMHHMLHALPAPKEEQQVKRFPFRAVIIAAVVLILMATTALALTRPAVLNWLLGSRPANPQLEQTAQSVIGEGMADGITARITGLVYDGSRFAFSYEVENSDPAAPVLVAIAPEIRLNGEKASLSYATAEWRSMQLIPSPHLDFLPVQRNPATGGGWGDRLGDALTGLVECEMTFIVCRPVKGLAVLLDPEGMLANPEEYDPQTQAEIADSLNTLRGFRDVMIVEDSPEAEAEYLAQGYTIVGSSGKPRYHPDDERSHLQESARIRVTFTFDASNAVAYDFSGAADVSLPDCTVQTASLRLTPLETFFDLRLIPQENSREAAQALVDKYGAWALTDESGQPVEFSEMDACWTERPYATEMDGQWVCRYIESLPGLLRFPEGIRFVTEAGELLRCDLAIPE